MNETLMFLGLNHIQSETKSGDNSSVQIILCISDYVQIICNIYV